MNIVAICLSRDQVMWSPEGPLRRFIPMNFLTLMFIIYIYILKRQIYQNSYNLTDKYNKHVW